jgi:ribonuclease HI
VKAFAKHFEGKPEINKAEAIGLLESLKWSSNMQTSSIQIEIDCLHVVHCLNNKNQHNTELGSVIKLCISLLLLNENGKVSYVRRQTNRVVHDLAQTARFNASHLIIVLLVSKLQL